MRSKDNQDTSQEQPQLRSLRMDMTLTSDKVLF